MKTFSTIVRSILIICLIILAITFFTKNSYRDIDKFQRAVYQEPIQSTASNTKLIKFDKDNYRYKLTPVANYEINALVVHRRDYRVFSLSSRDDAFPMDLCLVWGSNLKNKSYQNKSLMFSQDSRWCFYRYSNQIDFNSSEVSNNHLLIGNNPALEKKIKSISVGDQVRIKGLLVNTSAELIKQGGKYDSTKFSMSTSNNRLDSGSGACETIYVQNFEIIQKGNIVSHIIFQICIYLIIIILIWELIKFVIGSKFELDKHNRINMRSHAIHLRGEIDERIKKYHF